MAVHRPGKTGGEEAEIGGGGKLKIGSLSNNRY